MSTAGVANATEAAAYIQNSVRWRCFAGWHWYVTVNSSWLLWKSCLEVLDRLLVFTAGTQMSNAARTAMTNIVFSVGE